MPDAARHRRSREKQAQNMFHRAGQCNQNGSTCRGGVVIGRWAVEGETPAFVPLRRGTLSSHRGHRPVRGFGGEALRCIRAGGDVSPSGWSGSGSTESRPPGGGDQLDGVQKGLGAAREIGQSSSQSSSQSRIERFSIRINEIVPSRDDFDDDCESDYVTDPFSTGASLLEPDRIDFVGGAVGIPFGVFAWLGQDESDG